MSHDATGSSSSPLDTIPDPELVRDRLAAIHREAALLRALLRLAERDARRRQCQRPAGREVAHAR
jgi:hypothetical protein